MSEDNPPADHVLDGGNDEAPRPMEENLKSRETWTRFLFMLIACVLISLAGLVGTFVVLLGFLWVLFTGEVNRELRDVGQGIASYVYEVVRYLTFNADDRPFPLGGSWPGAESD